eukprot:scaffold2535_cov336-Prasinococcus_capsulatus_cf.AAC.6
MAPCLCQPVRRHAERRLAAHRNRWGEATDRTPSGSGFADESRRPAECSPQVVHTASHRCRARPRRKGECASMRPRAAAVADEQSIGR